MFAPRQGAGELQIAPHETCPEKLVLVYVLALVLGAALCSSPASRREESAAPARAGLPGNATW